MKHLITVLLILMSFLVKGQNLKTLEEIRVGDTIHSGQAIIYGNFIQRLGFSSGGFPQDIRLLNVDTKEIIAFRVKPTFKSTKENTFIYSIEPGNYIILNYFWTKSTWYGGKIYTEPIYKGIDASDDFEKKIKTGQIKENELIKFSFTITENSLNYMGTWHFDNGFVSFSDDKKYFDNLIMNKYSKLDFSTAKVVLPK